MSLGPYLMPATLIFRFFAVGLVAGADTVMVILRLTPFNFAITVAVPFSLGQDSFRKWQVQKACWILHF